MKKTGMAQRIQKTIILTFSIIVGTLIGILLSWACMTYIASPVFSFVAINVLKIKSFSIWETYITKIVGYLVFLIIVFVVINMILKLTKKFLLKEEPT